MSEAQRSIVASFAAVLLIMSAVPVLAQTDPPRTERIAITGDTVRFVTRPAPVAGVRYDYDDDLLRARFGYVRSTGRWIIMNRRPGPQRLRLPFGAVRSVPLVGGWQLVEPASALKRGFLFHNLVAPHGRTYPLRPSVDSATLRSILAYTGQREANVVRGLTGFPRIAAGWRVDGSTIWIGTGGNWAALVAFDTTSRTFRTYTTDWVADAIVRDIAVTRHAVWMVLVSPNGLTAVGLARFDRATHRWRLLRPTNSSLPEAAILAIDGVGDTLFVAGEDALAAYDDASGKWDVRWFRAVPYVMRRSAERYGETYVDSVVRVRWTLSRRRDPNENATRVMVDVAQSLESSWPGPATAPVSASSFLAAARNVPAAQFAQAYHQGRYNDKTRDSDLAMALAEPRLLAFVRRDAVVEDDLPSGAEIRAIGIVGDRAMLPYVQRALPQRSIDAEYDATVAWTRARLGDTSWLPLLRDLAIERGWTSGGNPMADDLVSLGDSAIIGRIRTKLYADRFVDAARWLHQHVPRDAWLALVHDGAADPNLGDVFLVYFAFYSGDATPNDTAVRDDILTMAHARLTRAARDTTIGPTLNDPEIGALHLVEDLRDAAAVPLIIPLLTRDATMYDRASATLIRMTAVDSAPGSPTSDASERAQVLTFWERWWTVHQSSFVVAEQAAGDAAEVRWLRRGRRSERLPATPR